MKGHRKSRGRAKGRNSGAIRVLAFNLALFAAGLLLIEVFMSMFLDRRTRIDRIARYIPEVDLIVLLENLDYEKSVDVYTRPFAARRRAGYRIVTDEHGARVGPETRRDRPYDLVILGDSFSFGSHADYGESLQGLLESGLPNHNVHNFAVPGSHSLIYPRHYEYFSGHRPVRPDVLVVGFYVDMQIGDLPRVLAARKHGSYKTFRRAYVSPSRYRQVTGSRLGGLLFEAELWLRAYSSIFNLLFPAGPSKEFAESLYPDLRAADFDAYRRVLLGALADIGAATGLPPERTLIWLVPSNHELKHAVERAAAPPRDRRFYDLSQDFWTTTIEVFEQRGSPVVDPREAVKDAFTNNGVYGFTVDGHLNAEGFAIVAEMILGRLRTFTSGQPDPASRTTPAPVQQSHRSGSLPNPRTDC